MADAAEPKPETLAADLAAQKAYAAAAETALPAKAEPAKAVAAPVKPAAAKATKPAPAPVPVKAAKPAAAKAPIAKKRAAPIAASKTTVKSAAKPAASPTKARPVPVQKIKETIMTKTQNVTEDFAAKVKDAVAEAQDRAKTAFDKGTALLGEVNEFGKGNIEALVESGKVLAAGLQGLGKDYVAEGKTAFETMTADVKELAAVKSPADFFKLQSEILRRNFDAAVASGSKHSESVVKLVNDAFAPISTRVSLAVEKIKQAA